MKRKMKQRRNKSRRVRLKRELLDATAQEKGREGKKGKQQRKVMCTDTKIVPKI